VELAPAVPGVALDLVEEVGQDPVAAREPEAADSAVPAAELALVVLVVVRDQVEGVGQDRVAARDLEVADSVVPAVEEGELDMVALVVVGGRV
jgi:hypothetical protein